MRALQGSNDNGNGNFNDNDVSMASQLSGLSALHDISVIR